MNELVFETRQCNFKGCKNKFKVLQSSPQITCSKECLISSGGLKRKPVQSWIDQQTISWNQKNALQKNDTHQRLMKEGNARIANELAKDTGKILRRVEPKDELEIEKKFTQKKIENEKEKHISPKRKKIMQDAKSGVKNTENIKTKLSENGIGEIKQSNLKRLAPVEIVETQQESSEGFGMSLQKEGLSSMSLLNKSANKLMNLMEESVSQSDMDQSNEGVRRVEPHRIMTAIECAKSLAQTIQVQANLVKAFKDIIK